MELLNLLLGVPLGYLMYLCYRLTGSYGMSIIVFTVLTKIILFPLSLLSQKNSIKMVKMQPRLDDIRIRNEGNIELIMQEQRRLYKEEGYSTVIGILPLLLQIPLILGLINVIYNPLQHLLHVSPDVISLLADKTMELTGVADLGYGGRQLTIMETVQKYPEAFLALPGVSEIVEQIKQADLMFLGINLSEVPKWASATVLVPLLSGASADFIAGSEQRKRSSKRTERRRQMGDDNLSCSLFRLLCVRGAERYRRVLDIRQPAVNPGYLYLQLDLQPAQIYRLRKPPAKAKAHKRRARANKAAEKTCPKAGARGLPPLFLAEKTACFLFRGERVLQVF